MIASSVVGRSDFSAISGLPLSFRSLTLGLPRQSSRSSPQYPVVIQFLGSFLQVNDFIGCPWREQDEFVADQAAGSYRGDGVFLDLDVS